MKIAAAQLRPTPGDIEKNIHAHVRLIEQAAALHANLVYFPELSLTGYEPTLAKSLAMDSADTRLDVFQRLANELDIIIGVGLPLAHGDKVRIGMVWLRPELPRSVYAKQCLHDDELPFFVQGEMQLVIEACGRKLAPAICYESLQHDHAGNAAGLGADVYLASVAKPARALDKAVRHYPEVAKRHNMAVIMADCIGPSDNFISVGQSAVWDTDGNLLAQMDQESEGLVTIDLESMHAATHVIDAREFRHANGQ